MNDEEIRRTIEELKAQVKAKPENKDKSDDEIDELVLDAFFKSYTEGKMSKDDLENLAAALGYEFTDEFKNAEDAPAGKEPAAPAGDGKVTEEEAKETQIIKPGESKEEFKEKIDEAKGDDDDGGDEDKKDDDFVADDDEEAQKEKAGELFGMKF